MEAKSLRTEKIFRWADRLIPTKFSLDRRQHKKARALIISYFLTGIFLIAFATLYQLVNYQLGVFACIYGAAVIPVLLLTFSRNGNFGLTGAIFDLNAMVMFSLLIYGTGGIHSSIVPWLAVIPASGFAFGGWRRGTIMSVLGLLAIVALAVLDASGTAMPVLYDTEKAGVFDLAVSIGLAMYIFMILLLYEMGKEKQLSKVDRLYARIAKHKQDVAEHEEALAYSYDRISNINGKIEKSVHERTKSLEAEQQELMVFWQKAVSALHAPVLRVREASQLIAAKDKRNTGGSNNNDKIAASSLDADKMLHKLMAITEISFRDLEKGIVHPVELLEQEIADQQGLIRQKEIQVDVQYSGLVAVLSDAKMIRMLLTCLLENALHFTAHDGSKSKVQARIALNEGLLKIEFTDDGIGIARQNLSRVSEMFFQANSQSPGSGLGLFLVDKIVNRLRGTWEIISEKGAGTSVRVSIPVAGLE